MTSKRERLEAALAGEIADRPPVALWRHFPVDDQDPAALAESTIAFQRTYDFDFVKVTPASSYAVRDRGAEDVWEGSPEGTRRYTRHPVQEPEDWARVAPIPPDGGSLGGQLSCLKRVVDTIGAEAPVLVTVFSPLAQAKNLAGQRLLLDHLSHHPEKVSIALKTLAEDTARFISAARSLGVDGVFYAVQHASAEIMDRETYRREAEPHDRAVLEASQGLWLNVLHLHGNDVFFDLAESYPVSLVNWHDRETPPGVGEGRRWSRKAVCGGISREDALVLGDPVRIAREAEQALSATDGGRGLVLGTGCVVPLTAPMGNLRAVRAAVELR